MGSFANLSSFSLMAIASCLKEDEHILFIHLHEIVRVYLSPENMVDKWNRQKIVRLRTFVPNLMYSIVRESQ